MRIRALMMGCFGLVLSAILPTSYASTETTKLSPYSDPSKSIIVTKANPQFIITLASNRTTGYSWHLLSYNNQLLTLVDHKYQAPQQAMPGAGGQEVWTFKVNDTGFIAPQVSKIDLLYARPWNLKDNSKQIEFKVVTQ